MRPIYTFLVDLSELFACAGPSLPLFPFSLCSGWLAAVRFFTVNVGAAVVMLIPAILFSLSAVMMAITLVKVSWQVCLHRAPVSSGVAVKSFVTWELTGLVGEDTWPSARCAGPGGGSGLGITGGTGLRAGSAGDLAEFPRHHCALWQLCLAGHILKAENRFYCSQLCRGRNLLKGLFFFLTPGSGGVCL